MPQQKMVPITKILSLSCRNVRYYPDLFTIDFESSITPIMNPFLDIRRNRIHEIIECCLSSDLSNQNDFSYNKDALIELRFVANNKLHFIRRVIESGTTKDLHLYIGELETREFYRDADAANYLVKFKMIPLYSAAYRGSDQFNNFLSNDCDFTKLSQNTIMILQKYENEIKNVLRFTLDWANNRFHRRNKRIGVQQHYLNIFRLLDKSAEGELSNVVYIEDFGHEVFSSILYEMITEFTKSNDVQVIFQSKYNKRRDNAVSIVRANPPHSYKKLIYKSKFKFRYTK